MIVNCFFTLSPIVETAIDFSDSCLCGMKLISFRQKEDVYITVYLNKLKKMMCLTLVIYVLLIVNNVQEQFIQVRKSNIVIICLFITGINIHCLIN